MTSELECTCLDIMTTDHTRHFRGCALREKYPDHPTAHMTKLAFHEKLFGAYVYNHEGEILRFRVFGNALEAEAWARRKSLKTQTIGPLPWCLRVFVETAGEVQIHGEVGDQ